jgi:hypothetical protein
VDQDQIIEGFLISVGQLIPNTRIRVLDPGVDLPTGAGPSGFSCDDRNARLWFPWREGESPLAFAVERDEVGLTDHERLLLELVPQALGDLAGGTLSLTGLSLRFSGKIGFGDLLVARFLDPTDRRTLNHRISLFSALQDLSFRFYEDKRCSSGFYFTEDVAGFRARVGATNYLFYPFDEPLSFHFGMFEAPASFRYVDGRNSYYVVDADLRLHGIVRLRNPDSYSLVSRLRNQHLKGLVVGMPGNPWVAFVGLREEVYLVVNPDLQLKWSRNHWLLRDRGLIFRVLDRFGLVRDLQELFVSLLFALSEGGIGASILIPDDPGRMPQAIGKIDHTVIGDHLRQMIQRTNIVDLNATNSLLGILGSDGLTTISRDGVILSCGDIIDISEAALLQSQGGGRSQAGIAASFFGLSIKISQNGPLSFYFQGKLLLQY